MAKQLQLSIPEPCHESWDAMTPTGKGRFCASCEKQVVDFSSMSDRQLVEFFKKPSNSSVCGRFTTDQLDRDIQVPRKRIPWLKYFFQVVLPAMFITRASAQGQPRLTGKVSEPVKNNILKKPVGSDFIVGDIIGIQPVMEEKWQKPVPIPSIPGKVINELGEPVPFASIQTGLENYYVVADEQGIFSIQLATISNKKQLTVSSVGYETAIVSINLTDKEIIVKLKTRETVLTECFLTSTVCNYRLGGVVGAVTVMGQAIQQTLNPMNNKSESSGIPSIPSSTIKIYPNPVLSGTNISIGIKEPAEGYYSFLLINAGGQKIKQEEGWVDAEARVFNFDIPPVAAGAYFITITNKTNGKKITERIIVQ